MSSSAPPYHYESVDGYSVVTLHPSLNDVQWANIERIGSDLLAQIAPVKTPAVLVDLSGLSYVGSAMVALVVRVWKAINERGGQMVVVNRHEMVLEVLRLAGLSNVWTIVPTREAGLNELGVGAGGRRQGSSAPVALALGILAAIAAAVGAIVPFVSPAALNANVVQILALAGGAASLVLGTIVCVYASGLSRGLGMLIVLVGLASVGSRGLAAQAAPPAADADSNAASPEEKVELGAPQSEAPTTQDAAKSAGSTDVEKPGAPATAPPSERAAPENGAPK